MNKGFKQYFKESYKKSFKLLNKTNNYFKYLLFVIMNCFASFLCILKPVTDMASVRMAKNIREGKDVCISNSIITSDRPKSYWNYILILGVKVLIFAAIFAIILVSGGLLALLGIALASLFGDADSLVLAIVFAAPAIILLIVFIFAVPYLSVPTAYMVDTYPTTNASRQIYSSFESLKRGGKKTLFVNDLVHYALILAYELPLLIIFLVLALTDVSLGLMLVVLLLALLVALYTVPRILLSRQLVKVALLEDIVLDERTLNQKFIGIDIDKISVADAPIEKRLLNVFENESSLNLEARLFTTIPNAKTEKENVLKQAVKNLDETELEPIQYELFAKKEENKPVEKEQELTAPVEQTVAVEADPVELEADPIELEEERETDLASNVKPVEVENAPIDDGLELDDIFEELDDIFLDSEGD